MNVPNLSQQVAIVNSDGTPTNYFVQWWNNSVAGLTQSLSVSGVTAGAIGSASKTLALSLDARGRVTGATAYDLNTSNVAEGTNLYYTTARAQAAVAGAATGILYSNGTALSALTVGSGLTLVGSTLSASGGGTGTVTSVALSGGTTGLTVTGSPITTSGTITLGGTLAVASGGTGARWRLPVAAPGQPR